MSPPRAQRNEEPIPAAKPVSGSTLPHIPRKWVRDAVRLLADDGYAVTHAEAWHLLKRWRAWRRDDAERFIASEFLAYARRRGDLIQVRGKPHHAWRTNS